MKTYIKSTWVVYGEYGGEFSRLDDAKECAKFASTTPEYDYKASICRTDDGCYYIDYENGKLVRDGWTLPKLKKTGKTGKFKFGNKVVEKPIYITPEGVEVVKYDNKLYRVNR